MGKDLVRPLSSGWLIAGEVAGADVDEFADPERVSAALAASDEPGLLAVQHPHRTPAAIARGLSHLDALPIAVSTLDSLLAMRYRHVEDVAAIYRVAGGDGEAIGLLCLVDPDAVGAGLRASEDVYPAIVAERAEVLAGLRRATSAAMLVPVDDGARFTGELSLAAQRLGRADVSTVDSNGRHHQLWTLGQGATRDRLLGLAGASELLVADGNHRLVATRAAGVDGLYALITAGPRLRVGSIHRVLAGAGLTADDIARAWRSAGLAVRAVEVATQPKRGTVIAVAAGGALAVELPPPGSKGQLSAGPLSTGPHIDHDAVERVLIESALGIDPAGDHVRTLPDSVAGQWDPGDDRNDGDVLLRIASVPFDDVLAMHRAGRRMPRKSTYFTPKPRRAVACRRVTPASER